MAKTDGTTPSEASAKPASPARVAAPVEVGTMFSAAARALAKLANPADPAQGLLPDISRLREVSATVAVDVINVATAQGIARVEVDDPIEAV